MKISPNEEKYFKKAFDLYVKNENFPSDEELDLVAPSPELKMKVQKRICDEKTKKRLNYRVVLKRVAVAAVVFILMSGSYVLGNVPAEIKKSSKVSEIIEMHKSVMYETEFTNGTRYYIPKSLYKKYKADLDITGSDNGTGRCFKEVSEAGILFIQYMNSNLQPEIDLTADVYEFINGGLYIYNSHSGLGRFIWSDLGYVFEIRAYGYEKKALAEMRNNMVII